jgi:hypothetical protein
MAPSGNPKDSSASVPLYASSAVSVDDPDPVFVPAPPVLVVPVLAVPVLGVTVLVAPVLVASFLVALSVIFLVTVPATFEPTSLTTLLVIVFPKIDSLHKHYKDQVHLLGFFF